MNKKISFILVCSALTIISGYTQTMQEIKSDQQTYLWGEGSGSTLKAADQQALADIISQISTQVQSNFERTITETGNKFSETVNDVLKTYSNATLHNTQRFIVQHEPDAKVFRYIKRSEIAKVFESRKQKIIEFAKNGEQAVRNFQIADALRYFYWSQTLLRSHPDAGHIKMTGPDGTEVLLLTWLPVQINDIFAHITVTIDQVEHRNTYAEYLLQVSYKNHPVRNLDYAYWTGQDWTNIYSAKDGLGVAELPTVSAGGDLRLKIEYAFEGESAIDMELRDVMQKLPQVPYRNAYLNVMKTSAVATRNPANVRGQDAGSTLAQSNIPIATQGTASKQAGNFGTVTILTQIDDKQAVLNKVMTAISAKNYASVQNLFTKEGYSIFQNLMQYGNAKILKSGTVKYYQHGDFVLCRSVPMSFSFTNNNRTFVEDVVFTLDNKNKICNITFGLSKQSVDDIASNDFWSESTRLLLINFMENYKTAYALKRLDYIESIFSDNALIITGSVLKVKSGSEFQYSNNQIVRYNRMSKEQYMRNLQHCFKSNEFINLRFADNTVRQSGKGNEVYGIQIKQDYFSTNYGDTGYLFLLIDMTDSISPIIHVRTWQPEKHADGSIYGLSDF
ncbi:MAG: LPP20 family lipoprotein [Paludibacter sp.]|nr:LPP20 family lipoprotein [Paludibacter sp.]